MVIGDDIPVDDRLPIADCRPLSMAGATYDVSNIRLECHVMSLVSLADRVTKLLASSHSSVDTLKVAIKAFQASAYHSDNEGYTLELHAFLINIFHRGPGFLDGGIPEDLLVQCLAFGPWLEGGLLPLEAQQSSPGPLCEEMRQCYLGTMKAYDKGYFEGIERLGLGDLWIIVGKRIFNRFTAKDISDDRLGPVFHQVDGVNSEFATGPFNRAGRILADYLIDLFVTGKVSDNFLGIDMKGVAPLLFTARFLKRATGSVYMYHTTNPLLLRLGYNANASCNAEKDRDIMLKISKLMQSVQKEKILENHHHFDMHPLLEWKLKVLPHVIGWLERASTYDTYFEKRIDLKKLSSIYQFVHAMPMLCIESWQL